LALFIGLTLRQLAIEELLDIVTRRNATLEKLLAIFQERQDDMTAFNPDLDELQSDNIYLGGNRPDVSDMDAGNNDLFMMADDIGRTAVRLILARWSIGRLANEEDFARLRQSAPNAAFASGRNHWERMSQDLPLKTVALSGPACLTRILLQHDTSFLITDTSTAPPTKASIKKQKLFESSAKSAQGALLLMRDCAAILREVLEAKDRKKGDYFQLHVPQRLNHLLLAFHFGGIASFLPKDVTLTIAGQNFVGKGLQPKAVDSL